MDNILEVQRALDPVILTMTMRYARLASGYLREGLEINRLILKKKA